MFIQPKQVITIIVILSFAAIIATPLFYFRYSVYPYVISKIVLFQSITELIFFLWLGLAFFDKRYRPTMTASFYGLAGFLGLLIATAVFGVDPWRSFWSTYERMLGVVAILHFALFGLVLSSLKNEIPWKKFLYASLGASAISAILAIIQLWKPNIILIESIRAVGDRPGSTFGNPTFLSSYLLINVFLGLYLLIDDWRQTGRLHRKTTVLLAAATIADILAVIISQTRGNLLALAAGCGVLLVICMFRPPATRIKLLRSRSLYGGIIGFCMALFLVFFFTRSASFWGRIPGLGRFKDVSFSSLEQSRDLFPRVAALRAGWNGFLEKPFLGWGWDNFNIVFNKQYDPRVLETGYEETRFDKPHNFIMEYLVAGGLPLLLGYLAFFGLLVYEALTAQDRLFGIMAVGGLASYFVSNFFVFDTIGSLLMFYLLFGFIQTRARGAPDHQPPPKKSFSPGIHQNKSFYGYGQIVCLLIALFLIYAVNITMAEASYNQYFAFQDFVRHQPFLAIQNFKNAILIPTPYSWNFERDYAAEVVQTYFYNPNFVPKDEVETALAAMRQAAAEHPLDAYNHYALVDLYNQASDVNPEQYLAAAEQEAEIALRLSPKRQEVYFSLAKTKTLKKDYPAALTLLKKALDLDPKVPDAHFYYGLVLYASGNQAGYSEIIQALALGRQWKDFNEPTVVGGFFADSGHLKEAIEFYKIALTLSDQKDLEIEVKLGVAYFYDGQYAKATGYLEDVGKKFDFSKSPSYSQLQPILEKLHISPASQPPP